MIPLDSVATSASVLEITYPEVRCTCTETVVCEADKQWNRNYSLRHSRKSSTVDSLERLLKKTEAAHQSEPTKYRKWYITKIKVRLEKLREQTVDCDVETQI